MFEFLKGQDKILVTGPQRSGTTICAEMIGHDLGYSVYREESIDNSNFARAIQLPTPFVLQAPELSAYCHLWSGLVIFMFRDVKAIVRSQERIDWKKEKQELARYFRDYGPIAEVKYACWERFQRDVLNEKAIEVTYEALVGHPLWLPAEDRTDFTARQTKRE